MLARPESPSQTSQRSGSRGTCTGALHRVSPEPVHLFLSNGWNYSDVYGVLLAKSETFDLDSENSLFMLFSRKVFNEKRCGICQSHSFDSRYCTPGKRMVFASVF